MQTCSVDGCGKPKDRLGYCTAHYMRQRRNNGDATAGRVPPNSLGEFLQRAIKQDTDSCILWPFGVNKKTGYGLLKLNGLPMSPHRAALWLSTGVLPSSKIHAAHVPILCHNRLCINPRHLRWATAKENAADKKCDGTHKSGVLSSRAKLTAEQVITIRKHERSDMKVALDYGVSEYTVWSARKRITYKDVP